MGRDLSRGFDEKSGRVAEGGKVTRGERHGTGARFYREITDGLVRVSRVDQYRI